MTRTSSPIKVGILTKKEYDWLKPQDDLTESQKQKIAEYEQIKPKQDLKTISSRNKIVITKELIWKNFLVFYKHFTKNDFIQTPETIQNISSLINYFTLNKDFLSSNSILRNIGNRELIPSFNKGLLVIGHYGNGKTTYFEVLSKLFNHYQMPMRFKAVNAHEIVTEFESLNSPGSKSLFFQRYMGKLLYIDDVKKEKEASNYGKTEIIREVLEKRYSEGLRTFITCNYREGDAGNINDALEEFGERYGGHIYDRLLGSYNIIKFTGKSLR